MERGRLLSRGPRGDCGAPSAPHPSSAAPPQPQDPHPALTSGPSVAAAGLLVRHGRAAPARERSLRRSARARACRSLSVFSAGARAGSEPPGSRSTALTRPPPQLGLLPVLSRARPAPRPAQPARLGRKARRPAQPESPGSSRPDPPRPAGPLLSGAHPRGGRTPGSGAARARWLASRPESGAHRALGWASGGDWISGPLRPRYAPDLWKGRGLKPYSKHCTRTPLSRGRPLQFISLP